MRILAASLSVAFGVWTAAAQAVSMEMSDRADIALSDILETLASKVHMKSDLAFFETEVLHGKAKRLPLLSVTNDDSHAGHSYVYGPEHSSSEYSEVKTGKTTMITFSAREYSQKACLTFKQAQKTLKAYGWSPINRTNNIDSTIATFNRDFVSLHISNIEGSVPPVIEPWNPPETTRRQMAKRYKTRMDHNHLKLGKKAYDSQCVTMVEVRFAH